MRLTTTSTILVITQTFCVTAVLVLAVVMVIVVMVIVAVVVLLAFRSVFVAVKLCSLHKKDNKQLEPFWIVRTMNAT